MLFRSITRGRKCTLFHCHAGCTLDNVLAAAGLDKKDTFYVRLDFILLPIIGAVLSMVLLEPSNLKSAIFAGLSWSGSLMALLNNKKSK